MFYVLAFFVGLVVGAICMFLCLMIWFDKVKERERAAELKSTLAHEAIAAADAKQREIQEWAATRHNELESRAADIKVYSQATHEKIREWADSKRNEFDKWADARRNELDARDDAIEKSATAKEGELFRKSNALDQRQAEFEKRIVSFTVSYDELQEENSILKRDLQNIDVNLRKLELDGELREQKQKEIDGRSTKLAQRYLAETVKSLVSLIGPNNFSACKQRLLDVIGRCREIGFQVSIQDETKLLADLRQEFEKAVKEEFAREEQARIRAQIRDEERMKREVDRELKQLERERAAIRAALDQALAEAKGQHSAEVQRLQERLTEAEERSKRTISMAEQTKAGHVYVISNIGTLGEGIFKVGMTRRLIPQERIDELGSASVPFPFDVHMMISCDNAPALENALHRALHKHRVNRARPRKEFFRTDVSEIDRIVREHHGEVQYVAEPEALEYRQSVAMSDDDAEYIETVYNEIIGEDESSTADDL